MIEAKKSHFEGYSLKVLGKKSGLLRACVKPGAANSRGSTRAA